MNLPQTFKGTLADTSLIMSAGGFRIPFTIHLFSSDGSRDIQLTGDGTHFFTPTSFDFTDANNKVLSVNTPMDSIKIIGAIGDTYAIIG